MIIIYALFLPNLPLSPRPQLFKHWIVLPPDKLITIQWIFPIILIGWIVIYPVTSAIQLLNNLGLVVKVWSQLPWDMYRVQLQIWLQWLRFFHYLHYTAFCWPIFRVSHCKCFISGRQKKILEKVEFGTLKHR